MANTILIVTDDSNTAYLLRRYAEESSLQTLNVGTVVEAFPFLATTPVSAVILEVKNSSIPARELLQHLRAHPGLARLPLIVYRWTENGVSDLDPYVSGYLHRPLLLKEFVAVLEKVGLFSDVVQE